MDSSPLDNVQIIIVDDSQEKIDYLKADLEEIGFVGSNISVVTGEIFSSYSEDLEEILQERGLGKFVLFLDQVLETESVESGNSLFRSCVLGCDALKALHGVVIANTKGDNKFQKSFLENVCSDDGCNWKVFDGTGHEFIEGIRENPESLNELFNKPSEYDVECNIDKKG